MHAIIYLLDRDFHAVEVSDLYTCQRKDLRRKSLSLTFIHLLIDTSDDPL